MKDQGDEDGVEEVEGLEGEVCLGEGIALLHHHKTEYKQTNYISTCNVDFWREGNYSSGE